MHGTYLTANSREIRREGLDVRSTPVLSRIVLLSFDGRPDVDLRAASIYLTGAPGHRVAFIQAIWPDACARVEPGRQVRLEAEESNGFSRPVAAWHVIERGVVDYLEPDCVACGAPVLMVVVTEVDRPGARGK